MLRGASPSVRTFASLAMPTTSQGGSSSRRRTSRPTASPSVQQQNSGLDRRPVCDEGAVVCRRLEPVDIELGRARAERVQVQVADGADRLDAGERPEAIQQAPRVDARLVAHALLTAECELDPDLWVLETKTMDRHLALMQTAPAALRLRPVGVRGAGARTGRGRPLRRGQLQRSPADGRDRHPHGARRRQLLRRPGARRGWPPGWSSSAARSD